MNWYVASFEKFPFKIKSEISSMLDDALISEDAIPDFRHYFISVFVRKQNPEKYLLQLVNRYPDVPHFRMLVAEAGRLKNTDPSLAAREELTQNFSSHLLGLAYGLCAGKEMVLPAIFQQSEAPELAEVFPERFIFHPFEVWLYEHGLLCHLLRNGKSALAAERLSRLKAMSPSAFWPELEKAMQNPGKAKAAAPAAKPEEKASAKVEEKSAAKSEEKSAPKVEEKTAAKVEEKSAAKSEAKSAPVEAAAKVEPEQKTAAVKKAAVPDTKAAPAAKAKPAAEKQPAAETKPKASSKAKKAPAKGKA